MNEIELARDDLALDALAAGRLPDGADDTLGLLHALRTDLEPGEAPAAPAAPAVVPLRPRRTRRASLIALSAAAGLVVGALTTGAVVTADRPGQLFYAAHKAVLGDPDAAERVTKLLDDAAEEIAEGDARAADRRLTRAAEELGEVEDAADRDALGRRLARLRAVLAGLGAPERPREPRETESPETDEPRETDEPETEDPDDDRSGSNSGSGSDDSDGDNSGSGSLSSGSGRDGSGGDSSGKGSDDLLKTEDPDDE